MRCRLTTLNAREFALFTPFDEGFISQLKRQVPYGSRRWDPERRYWACDVLWHDRVVELCKQYFGAVESDVGNNSGPAPRRSNGSSPFTVLGVLDDAPPQVVDAAYRALVKLHHPDVAGYASTSTMAAINNAYEEVKRRQGR